MDKPLLGRRRMLELGAGFMGAATLAACAPAAGLPESSAAGPDAGTGRPGGAAPATSSAAAVPGTPAPRVDVASGSFTTKFRPDTPTGWCLATPVVAGYDQAKMPVALFLHGTGSDNRFLFDDLGIQAVLQRYLVDGGTPFAIAAVDGGDTWWHPRADGTDTQSMLLAEFLPLLASQGFDTARFGLLGLSMGGFGVLLL